MVFCGKTVPKGRHMSTSVSECFNDIKQGCIWQEKRSNHIYTFYNSVSRRTETWEQCKPTLIGDHLAMLKVYQLQATVTQRGWSGAIQCWPENQVQVQVHALITTKDTLIKVRVE